MFEHIAVNDLSEIFPYEPSIRNDVVRGTYIEVLRRHARYQRLCSVAERQASLVLQFCALATRGVVFAARETLQVSEQLPGVR